VWRNAARLGRCGQVTSRTDAIAGHDLDYAVQRRPYAEGKQQIEAIYIMELPNMD
jgi:hypothetical protein